MNKLFGYFRRDHAGNETPVNPFEPLENQEGNEFPALAAQQPSSADSALSVELQQLRVDLANERRDRAAEAAAREAERKAEAKAREVQQVATIKAAGVTWAAKQRTDRKILPASEAHVATLHSWAALAKAGLPTDDIDLTAALEGLLASLPAHNLTGEMLGSGALPAGTFALPNDRANEGERSPFANDWETVRKGNDEFFSRMGIAPTNGRNNGN